MMTDESPFYLGINHARKNGSIWYKNLAMGEGKLRTLMKQAASKANITDKKLTNHSGRRTAVTRLIEEGLPLTVVQQHTGHKNIQSLLCYQKNSIKKQKEISEVLSGGKNDEKKNENALCTLSKVDNDKPSPRMGISGVASMFFPPGTIIHGGNFNFNFGQEHNPCSSFMEGRRKRVRVIESDSDSE